MPARCANTSVHRSASRYTPKSPRPPQSSIPDVLRSGWDRLSARGRQSVVELAAGAGARLSENMAEVPLHRARAEKQPGPDLGIREPVAGELGDLPLLRS